ncbi:hypothetical protein [Halorhodospira halophila]|uniref:hypothetical protein n=1 Tax=Halorhodospira halophila TaxID=1053 RepID=UPI00191170FD|nr:hypothetical protein [Halorhodospira halophila]MBK5942945.1 hypothetical protein [Halorhodospira halophila]
MDIEEAMKQALLDIRKDWLKADTSISGGQLHSQLSSDWIDNLAGLLRSEYTQGPFANRVGVSGL